MARPRVRTSGKRKRVFCEALNQAPILLPIEHLPILNYILNSVIQKAVTVECTSGQVRGAGHRQQRIRAFK